MTHAVNFPPAGAASTRGCLVDLMASAARRALDVVAGAAGVALGLPFAAVLACIIKLDSRGPVFHVQEREGLDGRVFRLFKFRSMRADAEAACPAWASEGDPRVIRVGRVMRRTRMDELPQLLNVLAGSMTLVGPRPERPCFADDLARRIPRFAERTRVKPGITGWAQVSLPYGASVEDAREKLAYDPHYIRHRSLAFDLRILLATVRVVLTGAGAR